MSYNFIADFLEYGENSECPRSFIQWASLFPLAVAAGRRYFTYQGRFLRLPELQLCFVGPSGGKKSYAKDLAKLIITEAFPDIPIAADLTSRDDLIRLLASDETLRYYINYEGAEVEWHPLALFVDEVRHFMSYSPSAMIAFIVAIYGQKAFKCSTIKRKTEELIEPCVNIISCTTPDWITEHLKSGILAGGFSRRFNILYEPKLTDRIISRPAPHPKEKELIHRMKTHLLKISNSAGELKWTPEAEEFFDAWYIENRLNLPEDESVRAYRLTKDMHVVKLATMLALAEEDLKLIITKQTFISALSFFDIIEANLDKLYQSGGRNELAVPQQRMLDLIESIGGGIEKKDLLRRTQKDFSPFEQIQTIRFMQDSGQLSLATPVDMPDGRRQDMIMTPKKFNEVKKNNGKWVTNGEGKL